MYSLNKSLTVLLTLLTTTSVNLITNISLPVTASTDSAVPNSSSQVDTKQTSPSLPAQSRVEKAKKLFNQGYQQYQQNRYSEAEKSLWAALETLNGGSRMQGFQAPRTRKRGTSISIFGLKLFESFSTTSVATGYTHVSIPLDEAYVRIINNLSQGKDPTSTAYDVGIEQMERLVECISGKPELSCDEIVKGGNRTTTNNVSQNVINSVEDGHQVEIEILRLLQRTLIAQNREDKTNEALLVAQQSRNLELFRTVPAVLYALNNEVLQGKTSDNNLPKLVTPRNLSIKDIKKISIRENSTLVYYSIVSQEEIFVWVIQPTGKIGFKKINLSSIKTSLEETTRNALRIASSYVDRGQQGKALIQAIRDLRLRTNNTDVNSLLQQLTVSETEQKQNLQQLYQILIEPIKELLPTDPTKHVVIIPQGPLLLVPFSALQDASGQYLIEKHTIRIAPNLQSLLQKRSSLQKFPRGDEMLVVGNPTNQGISELPGAEQEAKAIARLSGSFPLIGNQAHTGAISQRIFNAKILHFATHGILDIQNSSSSNDVILLITSSKNYTQVTRMVGTPSPYKENHRLWYSIWFDKDKNTTRHVIRTNGSLPGAIVLTNYLFTSQEILNLKLKADLVVLSACNTAQGIPGDSIVLGLPLSLGLAGVPRVVVSLWAVPDAPTQKLMFEFYSTMRRQSQEGKDIDEAQALREAMLKVKNMEQYHDPINWAGFTLMDVSYRAKN
ncbi:CHAT domain-containing protein [Pelatocladus sp. BLCC-F211]|uniref:CHAT domain-containing protein n=1 Tax=Pelatocladus sp. BLCC-F211 TaxID=3342752 RepID=UPI0035B775D2